MENKKGAIELSINAIVIIVIAITVLGLALVFVRQMFQQTQETTLEVIKGTDLSKLVNPPSRDNPLTVTPAIFDLRNKEKKVIGVSFMNNDVTEAYYNLTVNSDSVIGPCDATGNCGNIAFTYTTSSANLKPDEIAYWKVAVNPKLPSITSSNTSIYSLNIVGIASSEGGPAISVKKADIVVTVNP